MRIALLSKRSRKYCKDLVAGERERVGLHAAGAGGFLGDRRQICLIDAPGAERGNAELGAEGADPVDAIVGGCVASPSEEAGNFGVAIECGVLRCAGAQCGNIRGHAVRQEGCAYSAVRSFGGSAEGRGEAVQDAEACVGESKSAEEAGEGHVMSGFAIGSIVIGAAKSMGGTADAVDAIRVDERVGA